MFQFPRAAVTKALKLCDSNDRNPSSHSLGDWESEARLLAGLAPSKGCEGESILVSLLDSGDLLAIAGVIWLVGASSQSLASSSHATCPVCASVTKFPLIRTPVILNLKTHLNPA